MPADDESPKVTPMFRATSALLVAGWLALSIAGCSPGSNASPPPSMVTPSAAPSGVPADAISIKGFEFDPPRLTVQAGSNVTWTNDENSLHTVTSGVPDDRSGLFDSGEFDTGKTFEFTFSDAGTYSYFCDRHEFMRGEVVVTP